MVAVTGIGAICAAGVNVERIMAAMYAGRREPVASRRIRTTLADAYPVFEVGEPLGDLYTTPLEREPTRTAAMALIACEEAMRRADVDAKALRHRRVGVCLGTTVSCTLNDEPFYRAFRGQEGPRIDAVDRYLACHPARFLARALGVTGPVATVTNACSSGTDAIGLARTWVEDGACDLAVAGGCDELSRIPYLGFVHLLVTSSGPCRPFDRHRNGLNLGEGAGIVILEHQQAAIGRHSKALARLSGYASFSDAHHPTAPHPDGRGLRRAIRLALAEAGLAPQQLGFVNAHATATRDNDLVEGKALRDLLPGKMPVVATKAYTGHALGAAGALEAVFTIQALLDRRLPPTAGFEEVDPEIGIAPTREVAVPLGDAAISTSLAFGGHNSVLVFERFPD